MVLKTLKDFSKFDCCGDYDKDGWLIDKDDLKYDAIKWIKALHNASGLELSEFTAHGSDSATNNNLIRWIMNFFNITDEDLK